MNVCVSVPICEFVRVARGDGINGIDWTINTELLVMYGEERVGERE